MRIVFVTQTLDPAHPVLAATVDQVAALAERVDEVVVLADSAAGELPPNCRVLRFRAHSRVGRGLRFETALARELRGLRRDGAVVAHMCPVYAVLAAPLTRPLGVPVALWFSHWRAGRTLRAAERAATTVVTVDRRSFPIPSSKVQAIGHGIDVDGFPRVTRDGRADGPLRILALGRYSPAKGLDVVVRAVAGLDAQLTIQGPTLTEGERAYRRELEHLVADLDVADRVRLAGAVRRSTVAGLFAEADVLVNNMRAGAPDKVVYEAAAACLPVVASNPIFDDLLEPEHRFRPTDVAELASRLRAVEALAPDERAELGRSLRARVVERHSVSGWVDRLLAALKRG